MESNSPEIRKPDIYVIARFLEKLWATGKPVKKTRLQMSVGLNYGTFKKYLKWLLDRGLVTITVEKDKAEHVCLTTKGLESYNTIVNWINSMIPGEL